MRRVPAGDARVVKRGAIVLLSPDQGGYSEVIRQVEASSDGAGPTVVLQLANGMSPSFRPDEPVTIIPA